MSSRFAADSPLEELYWPRIFAIGAGYHRYFSHHAYSTSRAAGAGYGYRLPLRDRKFADSLLEEAVCCELVSEMELGKSGFWDSDGKMDLFPKRSSFLSDCYYTHLSNADIAAAVDFPV